MAKQATPKQKRRRLDFWNKLAICILSIFLVGCISVFFILVNIINDPEGMRFTKDGLTTMSNSRIYDGSGNLIYEFGQEIREDVTYDQIPQNMIDAFLSIEDSRFFDHNGFDLPRFISAAINNLRSGDFSQGGSTLTMQMIDNAFTKNQEEKLLAEKGSISKIEQVKLKIQEIYLSLIAEQSVDKEAIFEYYVNRIWFGSGNNTRGIQKAANYYFNKDVSQLNLSEAAFLAGSVNAPGQYNPLNNIYDSDVDHLQLGRERRDLTLKLMLQHGYINEDEYNLAKNTRLEFAINYKAPKSDNNDPNEAYIDQVISEVSSLTGQDPGIVPMDIYTALNQDAQKQADDICKGEIVAFPNEAFDIGFGVIDNDTGEILAVGPGRRYHSDAVKHDNSTTRKQPGSSMKPLLAYCSTFDLLGWSTKHIVNDKAKDYFHTGQNLNNSDGKYNGRMTLQDALGVSKNCPAAAAMIDLVNETGNNYWVNFCTELGFDEDVCESFVEQYSIGGADMYASPIQQASAYTIFGNKGKRIDAHTVRKVIRRSDNQETKGLSTEHELISEEAAFMMSVLLEKVVTGGYQNLNEWLISSYPVYGKSGTSDWGTDGLQWGIPAYTYKDEWSVGYTSDFTIAVWSGYTSQYAEQGWYFTLSELMQGQAFQISHYMLDYMAKYGNYKEIERPKGVSDYKGGYIKTEFLNKGDSSAGDTQDEKTACEAQGGEWDGKECIVSEGKKACEASGGTWDSDDDSCTCPTGTSANGNVCEADTEEPDPVTPDPGQGGGNNPGQGGGNNPGQGGGTDPGQGGGTDPGQGGGTDPGAGGGTEPDPGQIAGLILIDPKKLFFSFSKFINLL